MSSQVSERSGLSAQKPAAIASSRARPSHEAPSLSVIQPVHAWKEAPATATLAQSPFAFFGVSHPQD